MTTATRSSTLGGAPTPDFSASSPWVTAVGGTSTGIDQNGNRVLETGWETGKSVLGGTYKNKKWKPAAPGFYLYGSGGGTSRLYAEPSYQVGVVPDALAAQNQADARRQGSSRARHLDGRRPEHRHVDR